MSVILVVDDEPTVRALVRDVLELEGFEVLEAPDGPSALTAVQEHNPALMVLDIMMPGMSGLDVLRTLRRDLSGNDLPIILLTAASDDDTTWAGWTAGASVFLPKPFDPNHLLDWVERLISRPDEGTPDEDAPVPPSRQPDDELAQEFGGLTSGE